MSYEIKPVKCNKDKIKLKEGEGVYFPSRTAPCIITGVARSGKGVVLANLLGDERFLKGAYDQIYLISESAKEDQSMDPIGIPDSNKIDDLDKAPEIIDKIMKLNRSMIEASGNQNHKCPYICIILDDVINNGKFMRNKIIQRLYISFAHYNITPFLLTQHRKSVLKLFRTNAQSVMFFRANHEQNMQLSEDECPAGFKKKDFVKVIEYATKEPYTFLWINKTAPKIEDRYWKCFTEKIDLEKFRSS